MVKSFQLEFKKELSYELNLTFFNPCIGQPVACFGMCLQGANKEYSSGLSMHPEGPPC